MSQELGVDLLTVWNQMREFVEPKNRALILEAVGQLFVGIKSAADSAVSVGSSGLCYRSG